MSPFLVKSLKFLTFAFEFKYTAMEILEKIELIDFLEKHLKEEGLNFERGRDYYDDSFHALSKCMEDTFRNIQLLNLSYLQLDKIDLEASKAALMKGACKVVSGLTLRHLACCEADEVKILEGLNIITEVLLNGRRK